jgi:hypothetical protein
MGDVPRAGQVARMKLRGGRLRHEQRHKRTRDTETDPP